MEWLSAEEKSRSMMPYLLDLPPLDNVDDKVNITEISDTQDKVKKIRSKNATTKKAFQETELEK